MDADVKGANASTFEPRGGYRLPKDTQMTALDFAAPFLPIALSSALVR